MQREDTESVGRAFISLLEPTGHFIDFMTLLIRREVHLTSQSSTLFRGTTMPCVILSFYGKHVGKDYLRQLIEDFFRDVQLLPNALEVLFYIS